MFTMFPSRTMPNDSHNVYVSLARSIILGEIPKIEEIFQAIKLAGTPRAYFLSPSSIMHLPREHHPPPPSPCSGQKTPNQPIGCAREINYLEYFNHFLGELHQRGVGDPPVDPIHEDPRPDGVRDRAELWLLVRLPPGGRELPGEGRRQPFADFRWHGVRLHLRQFVVLVCQPPKGHFAGSLLARGIHGERARTVPITMETPTFATLHANTAGFTRVTR